MRSYAIRLNASAQKEIEALDPQILSRVFSRIESLSENPRPIGCKKLKGAQDLWRIRVGDFRIVYSIHDATAELNIVRVRHRSGVY